MQMQINQDLTLSPAKNKTSGPRKCAHRSRTWIYHCQKRRHRPMSQSDAQPQAADPSKLPFPYPLFPHDS